MRTLVAWLKISAFGMSLLLSGAIWAQSASFSSLSTDSPAANSVGALSEPDFLPVEDAYDALLSWDADTAQLVIQWSIEDGYYLFRDRFTFDLRQNGQSAQVSPSFSESESKDDPYFGPSEVFYFNATVFLEPLQADALYELALTFQGCADAGLCYPPHTLNYLINTGDGLIQRIPSVDDGFGAGLAEVEAEGARLSQDGQNTSLVWYLLLAFMGGIILNLMPCVFPVLGLKVMGFVRQEGNTLRHGLVYGAGVVLSFAAVAALLIALQASGEAVGWGFQLQNPVFVALMACLFAVLAMNFLGLFEFSGSWTNAGAELTHKSGYSGSFFTGVLATLVASPCTAPFMGTALGFAATQPASTALTVFVALGLGMALPVVLLAAFPSWLQRLPKSGAWMNTLRKLLALPLLATTLWLAWVVGQQVGSSGMALVLTAALLAAVSVWILRFGGIWRILAAILVVLVIATVFRVSQLSVNPHSSLPTGERAQGFDASEIERIRQAGMGVFVDVTADWCLTCKANEALVLNNDAMQAFFKEQRIAYLVVDWTRYDANITQYLKSFKRNGIPLYVFYAADTRQPPVVLPQILTHASVRATILASVNGENTGGR